MLLFAINDSAFRPLPSGSDSPNTLHAFLKPSDQFQTKMVRVQIHFGGRGIWLTQSGVVCASQCVWRQWRFKLNVSKLLKRNTDFCMYSRKCMHLFHQICHFPRWFSLFSLSLRKGPWLYQRAKPAQSENPGTFWPAFFHCTGAESQLNTLLNNLPLCANLIANQQCNSKIAKNCQTSQPQKRNDKFSFFPENDPVGGMCFWPKRNPVQTLKNKPCSPLFGLLFVRKNSVQFASWT